MEIIYFMMKCDYGLLELIDLTCWDIFFHWFSESLHNEFYQKLFSEILVRVIHKGDEEFAV